LANNKKQTVHLLTLSRHHDVVVPVRTSWKHFWAATVVVVVVVVVVLIPLLA
jgi:hypothetical protein